MLQSCTCGDAHTLKVCKVLLRKLTDIACHIIVICNPNFIGVRTRRSTFWTAVLSRRQVIVLPRE